MKGNKIKNILKRLHYTNIGNFNKIEQRIRFARGSVIQYRMLLLQKQNIYLKIRIVFLNSIARSRFIDVMHGPQPLSETSKILPVYSSFLISMIKNSFERMKPVGIGEDQPFFSTTAKTKMFITCNVKRKEKKICRTWNMAVVFIICEPHGQTYLEVEIWGSALITDIRILKVWSSL